MKKCRIQDENIKQKFPVIPKRAFKVIFKIKKLSDEICLRIPTSVMLKIKAMNLITLLNIFKIRLLFEH